MTRSKSTNRRVAVEEEGEASPSPNGSTQATPREKRPLLPQTGNGHSVSKARSNVRYGSGNNAVLSSFPSLVPSASLLQEIIELGEENATVNVEVVGSGLTHNPNISMGASIKQVGEPIADKYKSNGCAIANVATLPAEMQISLICISIHRNIQSISRLLRSLVCEN